MKEFAERKGLTQEEFNEMMNDADYYVIEDRSSNRGHRQEKPR